MSKVYQLSEYQILDYFMTHVELELDLTQNPVQAKAKITLQANANKKERSTDLVLDGENMVLTSLALNGRALKAQEYEQSEYSLRIKNVPTDAEFILESTTLLGENTDLFGLYQTEGVILVKAETEGLRRVFYCHDRPDNLATYQTRIIANKEQFPILLANGSLIKSESLNAADHAATWLDTVPKPSYLFAMVAGQLHYSKTVFTTRSGRDLPIEFYVPHAAHEQCDFAKEVLKKALAWDEENYQLECDLAQHMVAGVDKYASGASEPTGLNLFNTANLYASEARSTDLGMLRVLEVVAHEFFHYWTGDRVTIRDWFNLPFKEGLTTFRAAMFREDLFGTDLIRLLDGKNLDERAPRQSHYTAVRSLYTAAAYEKSADICRMIMLVMGKSHFYKAMTQFLIEHDGGAVTLEQLIDHLSASSLTDLQAFLAWFTEDGIPQLKVSDDYDSQKKKYVLNIRVINRKSRPIPLLIGLLDNKGNELLGDKLLMINQSEMQFEFDDLPQRPTPSLLRSFSAPVLLEYEYHAAQLLHLMRYDSNVYNRCEAMRQLIRGLVHDYCSGVAIELDDDLIAVYRSILNDSKLSTWMRAELINLPSEEELNASFDKPHFEKIAQARQLIQTELATRLRSELEHVYSDLKQWRRTTEPQFSIFDIQDAGQRKLLKTCLSYLQRIDPMNVTKEAQQLFNASLGFNMSNTINALLLLSEANEQIADDAFAAFYEYWHHEAGPLNQWLSLQAAAHSKHVVSRVKKLIKHPAFDISNPNKVYALLGTFINNPYGFHAQSGKGYILIAESIITLDKINPALAARLTEGFVACDKYDDKRKKQMFDCIILINDQATSLDVKNVLKKAMDKVGSNTATSAPTPIVQQIADVPPSGPAASH